MDSSVSTILPPRVRVPSTPSMLLSFIVKFMQYLSCEKNENRLKRPGLAHFLKNIVVMKVNVKSFDSKQVFWSHRREVCCSRMIKLLTDVKKVLNFVTLKRARDWELSKRYEKEEIVVIVYLCCLFKFQDSFLFIFVFSIQLTVRKDYHWLDSNCGSTVSN